MRQNPRKQTTRGRSLHARVPKWMRHEEITRSQVETGQKLFRDRARKLRGHTLKLKPSMAGSLVEFIVLGVKILLRYLESRVALFMWSEHVLQTRAEDDVRMLYLHRSTSQGASSGLRCVDVETQHCLEAEVKPGRSVTDPYASYSTCFKIW